VRKVARTWRYEATPNGTRALTALRDKVIQPLLAAACQSRHC